MKAVALDETVRSAVVWYNLTPTWDITLLSEWCVVLHCLMLAGPEEARHIRLVGFGHLSYCM